MINKKWTPDRQELVKAYLRSGMTVADVSAQLKDSYYSVETAIKKYNLRAGIPKPTKVEDTSDDIIQKENKKIKKNDIVTLAKAIGERVYDHYKVIPLKEPKALKTKAKREETSILDISDIHLGMINEVFDSRTGKKEITYNMNIFEQELEVLQDSIFEIHQILRNAYRLPNLVINLLGDIVTNDRIFPEQSFEIEKVVGLQVFDAVSYLTKFINNMLKVYENIKVVAVVGNHGRSNPTHYNEPVENNFEFFIYKTLQKQFQDSKRVTIDVPETRRYIYSIYNWKHMIEHGDSIRGCTDTAIEKQIKELKLNVGGFDVMHFGHFHSLKEREISDSVIVKQNGCWIPKDNYGFVKFKNYSIPKQHFFGCNEKRVETWGYKIDLRG
jgi:transposase-like protein